MRAFKTKHSATVLGAIATILTIGAGKAAQAHVKWFAPYDVATQPRVIERVVTSDFVVLSVFALSLLALGWLLDGSTLGDSLSRSIDRVTGFVRSQSSVVLRAVCAFFLISVWVVGGTILTPELKTTASWVSTLQLAMAASLIDRRTALFAALGIVVLYVDAIFSYGIFHLLDYPIFLGVAAFLAADAIPRWRPLKLELVDLVRFAASITLMWASIEKWAYPEWTLPIYLQHPELTMGYDFEFFMQAAGVIEFALAFALLGPPLVRRAASFVLLGMFISAVLGFGKVDAIGHSVIIAVLMLIAADDRRPAVRTPIWHRLVQPSVGYAAAIAGFLSLYYGLHAIIFRTTII